MKEIKAYVVGILFGILILGSTSCVVVNQGEDSPDISIFAKSAVAQVVYSNMKKSPDKAEKIWDTTIKVLKTVDTTVGKTPEELSQMIKDAVADKVGDNFSIVIDGLIDTVFSKFKIKWNENIPPETLHKAIAWIIDAIETGMTKYSEAVVSAVANIPDELDTDGLFVEEK